MGRCLLLSLFLFHSMAISADVVSVENVIETGLPSLIITTNNGVEPWCSVEASPTGWGINITNVNKVPGRLIIQKGMNVLYDSGEYSKNKSGITIKVRGNTSAMYDKKPYKIKLQQKADLLGRGGMYEDLNWILIKDENLKFKVGFFVNSFLGLQWTPSYEYVNVIINGDYRGVYMLLESVERNTNCRLNVSTTGYIFELDAYYWKEDVYFESRFDERINYTFKYPENDDLTDEKISYIQSVVNDAEKSLIDGTYDNYIDVESFASWMLGQDILGNSDYAGSNMFYTKYDNTDKTKIKTACLWDFDDIMQTPSVWGHVHYKFWFNELFYNQNKFFVRVYKKKWEEIKSSIVSCICIFLEDYQNSIEGIALDKSIVLDNKRWKNNIASVSSSIEEAKSWFISRVTFLDNRIKGLNIKDETSGIDNPIVNPSGYFQEMTHPTVYNINGNKVNVINSKGIYIINGSKILYK